MTKEKEHEAIQSALRDIRQAIHTINITIPELSCDNKIVGYKSCLKCQLEKLTDKMMIAVDERLEKTDK